MTRTVSVRLRGGSDRSYRIDIAPGLLAELPVLLLEKFPGHRWALISDTTVAGLYAKKLHKILRQARPDGASACRLYTFPAGEASKTRSTKEHLEDSLLGDLFDRKTCIVAIGGGVTGDLAGFVAATYLRGVPFVQVPTTLLAQVDSSVGGKTGVDTPYGKNLVGAFWQPAAVCIDTTLLSSLPDDEYLSGLGEILKHALMFDARMIQLLEKKRDAVLARDPDLLADLVRKNCAIKAGVVSHDETETGLRKTLNFGHTAAHALETVSDYAMAHGIAVMLGMLLETTAAVIDGHADAVLHSAVRRLVGLYVPEKWTAVGYRPEALVRAMRSDKKNQGGSIHCSLPLAPGVPPAAPDWTRPFAEKTLLEACRRLPGELAAARG